MNKALSSGVISRLGAIKTALQRGKFNNFATWKIKVVYMLMSDITKIHVMQTNVILNFAQTPYLLSTI